MSAPKGKILMLTQYLHMGGLERMILNLSTELKAGGEWEPRVFVFDRRPDAGPENDLTPAFRDAAIPVFSFLKPPGFSVRLVLEIRRRVAAEGVSVIHTHDLGPLIYGACAKILSLGRVRLIHTQHSFVHLSDRRVYRYYQRFFARFADEIIVVSADTQKSYAELGVPAGRTHVVPNGVAFPKKDAPETAAERRQNRRDLSGKLDPAARTALAPFLDSLWILYMARVHAAKGQDHSLELWGRLSERARRRSVLLFVGPESEAGGLDRLRSRIDSSPDHSHILCMGTSHCPELWLGCADLSLSCSEFEGMPLGPIEAAGAGLPLVVSDIPGHDVVKPWSFQYPLSDPDAGAKLVEKILERIEADPDDYSRRLWEETRGVRSRFTLARMRDDYARLYPAPLQ